MAITQTVEIPENRRLVIDVPRDVPTGRAIISFTPASVDIDECPECAKHRDPITGELRFNPVSLAAFEETKAIMRGDIPAKRYKPQELTKACKDLLSN